MILRFLLLSAAAICAAQQPDAAQLVEDLEKENKAYLRLLTDWGGLVRYGSENAEVKLDPAVSRVVFLGDDLFDLWPVKDVPFFPGKPYFNRGIAKQTSPQMLVRFRQDALSLKPKVVVLMAGTNDLAGYAGPATEGTISENFMTMAELAKLHGVKVVIASLTPVCDCFKNITERRPPGRIIGLNGWLKEYAAKNGHIFANLYEPLATGRNMKPDLTIDGFLPNVEGYKLLVPVLDKAIAEALSR
jgi:lysophospholipase L1-like esterase